MDNKLWYNSYWYVIGDIIRQTNQMNVEESLDALKIIGKYIPCLECKIHYLDYLERNRTLDKSWLVGLKGEIERNKSRRRCGKC